MSIESITPSAIFMTITPSDTLSLNPSPSSLYVTSNGDLKLMDSEGNIEVFPVITGQTLPVRPNKVMVADANPATCIGLYSYNHQSSGPFTQYK